MQNNAKNVIRSTITSRLGEDFYRKKDVLSIARQLIGKIITTNIDGIISSGRIIETEAYKDITDKASHAYGGRRTERTRVMFQAGGCAYVYLCYGIHHLFNIVTNTENIPDAVLIRAIEPEEGIDAMIKRTGRKKADYKMTSGPGNVSKALGITTKLSGISLQGPVIALYDDQFPVTTEDIIATPRIGVDYAGEDALREYRFYLRDNRYVSCQKKKAAAPRKKPLP